MGFGVPSAPMMPLFIVPGQAWLYCVATYSGSEKVTHETHGDSSSLNNGSDTRDIVSSVLDPTMS